MKFDRSKLPDIVFWTSMAVLVLWALAKSFGLIHTPVIIEMIPLFTIAFAAGAFWNKFLTLEKDFHHLATRFDGVEKRLGLVEHKLA